MKKLFYVPIEPLEERYTQQWYDYFPEEFQKNGFEVVIIDGEPLTNNVQVGTFLDINSTIAYKNSQMKKIAELFFNKEIKDNDIFFIGDTEFWGLESLRLMADMNNVKIKIFSFLHAASYIKEDAFSIASKYQKYTELGWILANDKVFVGTEHHKNVLIKERIEKYGATEDIQELKNKIVVTGNPLFKDAYKKYSIKKENKIILPNRFDYEKRPNISLDVAQILKRKHPDWKIVITTSRKEFKSNKEWLLDYAKALEEQNIIEIKYNLTKEEYHKELATSKVMLSTNDVEETFGYCVVEALEYDVAPLCFNGLSHPELLENNKKLLYNDIDEIVGKIESLIEEKKSYRYYNDKYYNSINKIIKEINE